MPNMGELHLHTDYLLCLIPVALLREIGAAVPQAVTLTFGHRVFQVDGEYRPRRVVHSTLLANDHALMEQPTVS